ncbi:MAG: hypothetical protein HKN59_09730, partial [Gammaproteobacteria bacterium]|nr:hypothetical protein [Gammaproteobacteria bacterium]
RFDEAEPDYKEGLRIARIHENRMQGPILANLADLLCATGRFRDGLENAELSLSRLKDFYAADDWRMAHLASIRGGCMVRLGDEEAGGALLRDGHKRLETRKGPGFLFTRLAKDRLGLLTSDVD